MAASPRTPAVPPPLATGDHLSRDEFERRYAASDVRKAELIEGVVYVPSPARWDQHSAPHGMILTWLGHYAAATPGVQFGGDATVRLDLDNEPQPDAILRLQPEHGGRTRLTSDGYLEGPPELVVEVSASTASYDLHEKLRVYRRNGVAEYVVWRVLDDAVDWFVLHEGRYDRLAPDARSVVQSRGFPGLWLDVQRLLARDLAAVLRRVGEGVRSEAHAAFVRRHGGG